MHEVLVAVFTMRTSLVDRPAAEALSSTAKDTRLTVDTAAQHVASARFAGILAGIDPDLLLAIAHHESRYPPGVPDECRARSGRPRPAGTRCWIYATAARHRGRARSRACTRRGPAASSSADPKRHTPAST